MTPTLVGDAYYRAHRLIKHRGPDDEGFLVVRENQQVSCKGDDTIPELQNLPDIRSFDSATLVLGFRRLSIIDLSVTGHQPQYDQRGRYSIVFNGEIFNYVELREELRSKGVTFHTASDTEVFLQSFITWGSRCFNRFNGMWAAAIYDNLDQRLVLSRDRFGIKPLYYTLTGDGLVFSSEIKFITEFCKDHSFTLNESRLKDYLGSCDLNHTDETMWRGINELRPAHFMNFEKGRVNQYENYWNYSPLTRKLPLEEALSQFTEIFQDSLRLRMRSDVEVGSLLSGGLDSTTIVCALEKLGLIEGLPFKTFSAVFDEEQFSEKKYIDDTIKQLHLEQHFVTPKSSDLAENFDKILFYIEEPFRSLAVVSQFLLYREIKTKTKVKVVLNGQGADELFCGYTNHYYALLANLMATLQFRRFFNEFQLFRNNRKTDYFSLLKIIALYLKPALSTKNYFLNYSFSHLNRPLREYLKYDDHMSMAFGIEARVPFLDYRLVEWAFKLEDHFKIDHFVNKKILRTFARDLIPSSILNRKDKMGFVSPQEEWQRHELLKPMQDCLPEIMRLPKEHPIWIYRESYKNYVTDNATGKDNNWAQNWRVFCAHKWQVQNKLL